MDTVSRRTALSLISAGSIAATGWPGRGLAAAPARPWLATDDQIVFETFTKSQKVVNLKRDPRIAVLLEDGVEYDQLKGVSINGTAVLYDDPEVVWKYAAAVMKRNHPGLTDDQVEAGARQLASKRTAVIVQPEKVVTWDHTKLGGGY